jgi:predicted ATPase
MYKGAYSTAQHYYEEGLVALGDNLWSEHQSLAIKLTTMAAEAAYCNGRMDDMEKHLTRVLSQNVPLEQKMPAFFTRIRSFGAQEKFREAVSVGLHVLEQLGIAKISPSPNLLKALWELRKTKKALQKHTLASLTTSSGGPATAVRNGGHRLHDSLRLFSISLLVLRALVEGSSNYRASRRQQLFD